MESFINSLTDEDILVVKKDLLNIYNKTSKDSMATYTILDKVIEIVDNTINNRSFLNKVEY